MQKHTGVHVLFGVQLTLTLAFLVGLSCLSFVESLGLAFSYAVASVISFFLAASGCVGVAYQRAELLSVCALGYALLALAASAVSGYLSFQIYVDSYDECRAKDINPCTQMNGSVEVALIGLACILLFVWNGVAAVNIKRRLQQAAIAVLPVTIKDEVGTQKGFETAPALHGPVYYVPVTPHAAASGHHQAQYAAMAQVPAEAV